MVIEVIKKTPMNMVEMKSNLEKIKKIITLEMIINL